MRRLPLVIAVSLVWSFGCGRTLPGDAIGPLAQERFACVDADLGDPASLVEQGDTSIATNILTGSCGGELAPERAFLWTVPADGLYRISTSGSSFETALYLFNGNCSADELACSAWNGRGQESRIDIDAEQGAQLVIVVDGLAGGEDGRFRLSITRR